MRAGKAWAVASLFGGLSHFALGAVTLQMPDVVAHSNATTPTTITFDAVFHTNGEAVSSLSYQVAFSIIGPDDQVTDKITMTGATAENWFGTKGTLTHLDAFDDPDIGPQIPVDAFSDFSPSQPAEIDDREVFATFTAQIAPNTQGVYRIVWYVTGDSYQSRVMDDADKFSLISPINGFTNGSITVAVPEPGVVMLGASVAGVALARRQRVPSRSRKSK